MAAADAFATLTDSKSSTNWVLIQVDGKELKLKDSGSGGLPEMVGQLDQSQILFGAFKVVGVDDRESVTARRPKYVRITFVGTGVKPMQKMSVLSNKATINDAFVGCAVHIDSNDMDAFTPEAVAARLKDCGGAHKPTYYEFSADSKVEL